MRLSYYPETDSLYIELKTGVSAESEEVQEGVVLDFDESGAILGIDIDCASQVLDLSRVEAIALPHVAVFPA